MTNDINSEDALRGKVEEKMKASGCVRFRVIHENEAYTTDYNDSRYNVLIDESSQILREWVG